MLSEVSVARRDMANRLIGVLGVALVLASRFVLPVRGLDVVGLIAVRDTFLSIVLWATVLAVSTALGLRVLLLFRLPDLTRLESLVMGCMLGLGCLGLGAFVLGLMGWLTLPALAGLLLGSCAIGDPRLFRLASGLATIRDSLRSTWNAADGIGRSVAVLSGLIGMLAFVHALSPPWDYDGLMYHLVGPRDFLAAGRVFPDPDNWYVNGPSTLEMVFSFGLAYGDDVFPKLIHYSTGVILVLGAYAAGRRWLDERGAWLSTAILMGVPTLPIWAAFAYIDLGWSAFEFLALSAVLAWIPGRNRRWLVLSGVLTGFAAGAKYLGLMGAATLGLLVLVTDIKHDRRRLLEDALAFALPAVLIALPWYLKNLLWFGNPLFPLFFGGTGFDSGRLEVYTAYLNSYGMQRGVLGFLLLPWDVYASHARFGAVMNRVDIPAVLFPLLFAYPFLRRDKAVGAILLVVLARVALWAAGSQQLRFLLPVYPAMAVGAAYVVSQLSARYRRPWDLFLPVLSVGLMVLTLVVQFRIQLQFQPGKSALGLESRAGFLSRIVKDFNATRFAGEELAVGTRVLLLGDGRGYFCQPTCIPDPDHFRWAADIAKAADYDAFAAWAQQRKITHLLLSLEDLDFLLQHDPTGVMSTAVQRLVAWKQAGCLPTIFRDEWSQVLALDDCD